VEELLDDGREGLLFEPGDAADLARALGRLLDDAAFRDRVAEAGWKRVRDEHPASSTRRRLLEAYARILPRTEWAPPGRAPGTIDGLPAHPDTTTSRRSLPAVDIVDGRAQGERSGEIVIPPSAPIEIPVTPGEIVIEALDFASAGEPFELRYGEGDVSAALSLGASDPLPPPDRPTAGDAPDPPDLFEEDERTLPGPMRPRKA
jgi:hypothetical protein